MRGDRRGTREALWFFLTRPAATVVAAFPVPVCVLTCAAMACAVMAFSAVACTAAPQSGMPRSTPASFRNEVPLPGPEPTIQEPSPRTFVLNNGMQVWALPWDAGTTALEVTCRIGSQRDPMGRAGLVSLLVHMLTEGTSTRTSLQQAQDFEDLGAGLDVDVGPDSMTLATEVLPSDAGRAIELLAEALQKPGLRSADFERLRAERRDDLLADRDDPGSLSWLIAQRATLGPQRGRPGAGSPRDLEALTVDELRAFHDREVRPERCVLLAAGSFDTGSLFDATRLAFEQWLPEEAAWTDAASSAREWNEAEGLTGKVLFLRRDESVQSAVCMAMPLPPRLAPGYEARLIVNNAFGGLFTSRLNTNLRENHGYTYGAYSRVFANRDYGAWFISTSVRTDVTVPALEETRREVELMGKRLVRGEERERARTDLLQRQRARLEHVTWLLSNLSSSFVYGLPAQTFQTFGERLAAVDNAELDGEAKRLSRGPFVTVVVGTQEVERGLRERGFSVQSADPEWLR